MSTEKKYRSYSDELKKKYGRVSFARFLISWRECDELTQAEFAKKLGMSSANLCDLEQGRRIPSPDRARKIAKKLGLPEMGLVAKALEDVLYREGMKYSVELREVA
jgi:transcriptional regulator with XRE-family HTH domain